MIWFLESTWPTKSPGVFWAGSLLEEIDRPTLEKPEEMVAQVIRDQLRETWGTSINFDKLFEAVRRLAEASSVPTVVSC
jgi:hypothetical protein